MSSDPAPASPSLPRSPTFDPGKSTRADAVAPAPASPVHEPMTSAPVVTTAHPATSSTLATASDRNDRGNIFGRLVRDDGDIAGLVAYSIYKQNKLDWLRAFETETSRAPDERELASYIIGEATPRRIATYRHLAEATLAGNGPEVAGAGDGERAVLPSRVQARAAGPGMPAGMIALYALIAVMFVVGFWLALHYTAATR